MLAFPAVEDSLASLCVTLEQLLRLVRDLIHFPGQLHEIVVRPGFPVARGVKIMLVHQFDLGSTRAAVHAMKECVDFAPLLVHVRKEHTHGFRCFVFRQLLDLSLVISTTVWYADICHGALGSS